MDGEECEWVGRALKSRWRSHELGEMPRPLAGDSPIQAISLLSLQEGNVSFRWKDYRQQNQQKVMTLTAEEFIRRFLLHVLPDGFQRIRHYGFLGNRHRQAKLALCRQLLAVALDPPMSCTPALDYRARYELLTGRSLESCPMCAQGRMVQVEILPALRQSWPVLWRDTS